MGCTYSRGEKRSSSTGASGPHFKIAWKGERDKTRLSSDEGWDGVPKLEEISTNGIPQSASLGVGYKVPHLKCFYTNARSIRNKHKRSSRPWSSPRDLTSLEKAKPGEVSAVTGVPCQMVTGFSGGIVRAEEVEGWHRM